MKIDLLKSYFLSLYGCGLWDLQYGSIENICLSWRAGLRRTWGLLCNCRSIVVDILSNTVLLYDVICKCSLLFARQYYNAAVQMS